MKTIYRPDFSPGNDPEKAQDIEVVEFFSSYDRALSSAEKAGTRVREWVDPWGISFTSTRLAAGRDGDVLVQRFLMPLLDPSWTERHGRPADLRLFAFRGQEDLKLVEQLRTAGYMPFFADGSWPGDVVSTSAGIGADSVVVLETFYGRLYGDPTALSPQLGPPTREGLRLIYPGSEWGLPNNPEGYNLYYQRMWRHIAAWTCTELVRRPAMCLDQVTDRQDQSVSAAAGFVLSLQMGPDEASQGPRRRGPNGKQG